MKDSRDFPYDGRLLLTLAAARVAQGRPGGGHDGEETLAEAVLWAQNKLRDWTARPEMEDGRMLGEADGVRYYLRGRLGDERVYIRQKVTG